MKGFDFFIPTFRHQVNIFVINRIILVAFQSFLWELIHVEFIHEMIWDIRI